MKKSIYTVPDGFFEKSEKTVLTRAGEIKKRRVALMFALPVLLVVSFFVFSNQSVPVQDYSELDNCDIFMELFEY